MVHGDLKPDNIIILPNTLMITDFGMFMALPQKNFVIAQMGFGNRSSYLAPEVRAYTQNNPIGLSADIYSLGVILCEMLTGKIYEGGQASLPPLPEENKFLLPLLNNALRQNPSQRIQTVHEFFDEFHLTIRQIRPEKAPPRPSPPRGEAPKPPALPPKRPKPDYAGEESEATVIDDSKRYAMPTAKEVSSSNVGRDAPIEKKPVEEPKPTTTTKQSDETPAPSIAKPWLPVGTQIRRSSRSIRYIVPLLILTAVGLGAFLLARYILDLQSRLDSAQETLRALKESSTTSPKVIQHESDNSSSEKINKPDTNPPDGQDSATDNSLMYVGFCAPDRSANCQSQSPTKPQENNQQAEQPMKNDSPSAVAQVDVKRTCLPGMALIPAGKALLGSSANDPLRNPGEDELHNMNMNNFCIDRYEFPNEPGITPLVNISYPQAEQLCKKRGKRLCTEEEWEYTCKGGGSRDFPYGDHFDADLCNTRNANGKPRPIAPAGAYEKCFSPFGVFDLSGNANEWIESIAAGDKITKGGSFAKQNWATRCAARVKLTAASRKEDLGFRCCADAY